VKDRKIISWIAILAFLFGAFATDSSGQRKQTAPKKKTAERPLPNLVLKTLDGEKWSLSENRGRVVLLNFWATWCEPCRTETPMLVKLADEYEEAGLKVVGIALDENAVELIRKFAADYKIDYPILLPVPDSLLSRIDPVPTTLLIDGEGRLAKKYVGAMPEDLLRKDIEKLVDKLKIKK
jgi:cytochrome c biogenesis protein CcmG/thiol:disulfide interchange protein DsbE